MSKSNRWSFNIDLRLQRHFTLLAPTEPNTDNISEIYTFILKNHFKDFRFAGTDKQEDIIDKLIHDIIEASCVILDKVKKGNKCFFPSATKFHYQWNMREISRVIDGVLEPPQRIIKMLSKFINYGITNAIVFSKIDYYSLMILKLGMEFY